MHLNPIYTVSKQKCYFNQFENVLQATKILCSRLDKMFEFASELSKDIPFVRVDFYEANGCLYFGELTFFPAGGAPDFKPIDYDKIVGDMWDIGKNNEW